MHMIFHVAARWTFGDLLQAQSHRQQIGRVAISLSQWLPDQRSQRHGNEIGHLGRGIGIENGAGNFKRRGIDRYRTCCGDGYHEILVGQRHPGLHGNMDSRAAAGGGLLVAGRGQRG